MMWKHIAANAFTVMIALLVGVAVILGWVQGQYRGAGPLASAVCLKVPAGSNFRGVSEELVELGVP